MEHAHDVEPTPRERLPYQPPEIEDVGSFAELTQAKSPLGGTVLDSTGYGPASQS